MTLKSDYFRERSELYLQTNELKNTVLKRHLVYRMNIKVEHYLLVGHSRNALRNYSNQIAAAAALLLSENLLVEKQAN